MSTQEFSIGEYVERRTDGQVGIVRGTETFNGDILYRVELLRRGYDKDDNTVLGSEQAWRRHHRLHAHVSTSSADCDGTYSGGQVYEMTLQERCDMFGDFAFRERVLGSVVNLHGHGRMDVTPDGIEWREQTEEGYRAAEVRWCEDDCPEERSWQRDHRAEAAGY